MSIDIRLDLAAHLLVDWGDGETKAQSKPAVQPRRIIEEGKHLKLSFFCPALQELLFEKQTSKKEMK